MGTLAAGGACLSVLCPWSIKSGVGEASAPRSSGHRHAFIMHGLMGRRRLAHRSPSLTEETWACLHGLPVL